MGYKSVANNMVYLHSFSCCWLPNIQNLAKFCTNSSL